MKSINNLRHTKAAIPLLADDILEFHASRLLLLLRLCGTAGRIDGLTKMAKLDFLVRYPSFFERLTLTKGRRELTRTKTVESSMVRYHYGPWDTRYYQVLAYLEAKDLLKVSKSGRQYQLELTELGKTVARGLAKEREFETLVTHMKNVKKTLGSKAGSTLKRMIYESFQAEVANKSLGEVIEQ